jgi:hypothetical protein
MDLELEKFKTEIDLRVYAAGQGYQIDRKESWSGSAVMRGPNNDKIIISRKPDGHYTYWSVRNDKDRGTVIDFISNRTGRSLGQIRKELREWMGTTAAALPTYPALPTTSKDRHRVAMEYAKMQDALRHPYLENERGIAAELLMSERFSGRVRIDARGNAIFPHFDQDGLCGFEKKNSGFSGFSSGGTKGLALSHVQENDKRMVFGEGFIDMLSYALLFPDEHTRYASVGGKLNSVQPELIRAAIARMPFGSEIVAAFDADEAGRGLAVVVRRAVELSGRGDLRFQVHEPEGAKDWNDLLLRARPKTPLPHRPEVPSVA